MKDYIDQYLNEYLQRDVKLMLDNKIIRQGKFLIYSTKDYIISFTLRNNKDQIKIYDVFYPYDIYINSNKRLVFDYQLEKLVTGVHTMADSILEVVKDTKTHKLFNRKLLIVSDTE